MNDPGRLGDSQINFVYTSTTENSATKLQRKRWIFDTVILTLVHWLGLLLWCSEATLAIAKLHTRKKAPPAVRLEPAIQRRQLRAFYQLSPVPVRLSENQKYIIW